MKESPIVEKGLGGFKYLLSIFMMYAGIATMFLPLENPEKPLGFLYSTRFSLVMFGVIFFLSGLSLFYGKVRKSRLWTGRGLLAIYNCFLFAAVLDGYAYKTIESWLYNAILAIIVAALWLRWKYKHDYVNPNHFIEEVDKPRHLV